MKRILFLIFLVSSIVFGQRAEVPFILQPVNQGQYGVLENGTTQYQTLTPVAGTMDLNGSEMLTNPSFEVNTTGWAAYGPSNIVRDLSIFHSGVASCKITIVSDNAGIISSNITNTTTNKYTFEAWIYIPAATSTKSFTLAVADQIGAEIAHKYLSATADTWTKVVINLKLSGTQTGIRPFITLGGGGTSGDIFYVDNCSLTQAYDAIYFGALKTNSLAAEQYVFSANGSAYFNVRSLITSGAVRATFSDGTNLVAFSGGSLIANTTGYALITFQRDGNGTQYFNGVQTGTPASIVGVGKISTLTIFQIGANGGGLVPWNGLEGEFQIVRGTFTAAQLAQYAAQIGATKKCLPSYPNQVSGGIWIDWKTMVDKFGIQGALTNVDNAPIVKVR